MSRKLYLAYGANTNHSEMEFRCPDAEFQGLAILPDHCLVFCGPCDVIPAEGFSVQCALWSLTARDERNLDIFEGFPSLYKKSSVMLPSGVSAFFYLMQGSRDFAKPTRQYLDNVMLGYEESGIDLSQIFEALRITKKLMERE